MNLWREILLLTTVLALCQAAPVLDKKVEESEEEEEGEVEVSILK